jgi:hypothetical protein
MKKGMKSRLEEASPASSGNRFEPQVRIVAGLSFGSRALPYQVTVTIWVIEVVWPFVSVKVRVIQ